MSTTFAITFDYLCPFARNANEHVVEAMRENPDWDVTFTPYSLAQGHVEEGEDDLWDREDPAAESGILALLAGLTVRDHFPAQFPEAHLSLFAARHDDGDDIGDPEVVRAALERAGVDADDVFERIETGEPLETLRKEHDYNVEQHDVWGVPTFVGRDRSVFVRLLHRPEGDAELAAREMSRIVDLVDGWPELHEFKQTDLPV